MLTFHALSKKERGTFSLAAAFPEHGRLACSVRGAAGHETRPSLLSRVLSLLVCPAGSGSGSNQQAASVFGDLLFEVDCGTSWTHSVAWSLCGTVLAVSNHHSAVTIVEGIRVDDGPSVSPGQVTSISLPTLPLRSLLFLSGRYAAVSLCLRLERCGPPRTSGVSTGCLPACHAVHRYLHCCPSSLVQFQPVLSYFGGTPPSCRSVLAGAGYDGNIVLLKRSSPASWALQAILSGPRPPRAAPGGLQCRSLSDPARCHRFPTGTGEETSSADQLADSFTAKLDLFKSKVDKVTLSAASGLDQIPRRVQSITRRLNREGCAAGRLQEQARAGQAAFKRDY